MQDDLHGLTNLNLLRYLPDSGVGVEGWQVKMISDVQFRNVNLMSEV